jgi:nitrite reductase/ring-hydroxylating ferredoxin subunit
LTVAGARLPDGHGRVLCALDEPKGPGIRGFQAVLVGEALDVFVVRRGDSAYGYRNRCPHAGASLDWKPDRFLDPEGSFIDCALHGALFRIEDGRCLRGPCAGEVLPSVCLGICPTRAVLLDR